MFRLHKSRQGHSTTVATLYALALALQASAQTPATWKGVDSALGRSGTLQGETYRVGFPRNDLHVTVGAVTVRPALALGSWVAFKQTKDSVAMLMGDLVLLESEVGPVVDALQRGGIDQTALHNHLVGEMPHVMYLHISGRGGAAALATTVREALARTGTPPATPAPASQPAFSLDTAQIAQVIGEPTGTTSAATTGDFVLIASEVNPVLRALRANGIQVTALHSHMLNESPRLLFMHFWGEGDALKLARGLRPALDEVNSKRN